MNYALLATILAATDSQGFMFVASNPDTNELASSGLIQVNSGMQNPNNPNEAAARITDTGRAELAKQNAGNQGNGGTVAPQTNSAPTESKPSFERVRIALPAEQPRATGAVDREEKYPFSELLPYNASAGMDAIFVAPTAKMPDPAKSLVSAVSAANRRYGVVVDTKKNRKGKDVNTYGFKREFKVFPSTDANKPGAWIGRVDDGSREGWTPEQFRAADAK
jgi:hypothetical protein